MGLRGRAYKSNPSPGHGSGAEIVGVRHQRHCIIASAIEKATPAGCSGRSYDHAVWGLAARLEGDGLLEPLARYVKRVAAWCAD
jgi:hypothetical protein